MNTATTRRTTLILCLLLGTPLLAADWTRLRGPGGTGISPDPEKQQKKFDDRHNLGFPLLCDTEHQIAEAYGVWGEKKMYGKTFMGIVRSSFLMDEKGNIAAAWYKISPKNTVPEVKKALERAGGEASA